MARKKKIPNPNHPKKGSDLTVEPLTPEQVGKVKKYLKQKGRLRDLALFTLSCNNGLRMRDVLNLTVGQVRDLKPGEEILIRESKNKKQVPLYVNKATHKALHNYLKGTRLADKDWLFPNSRNGKQLSTFGFNSLIKRWTKDLGIRGRFGCHTPRKTWAYIMRTKYGVDWLLLCRRLGHSSPAVTMVYAGIKDKEVSSMLENEV